MPKIIFERLAFNIKDKKKPVESDKSTYLGLEHLESGTFVVSRFNTEGAPKGEKLVMKKGDVLFGKRRAYQRKVAIAPFDGIFSAHGMVLRPNTRYMDPAFFPFFIRSNLFLDTAISISVGSLSPTVNWKDLKDIEFCVPALQEQTKLAKILWALEKYIEDARIVLNQCDDLIKSRFVEMFGTWDLSIQSRDWPTIKDCAEVFTGTTPDTKNESYWMGTIKWISPAELTEDTFYVYETEKHISEEARKAKNLDYLPTGTVLLSSRAPIGKVGIVGSPLTINQGFKGILGSSFNSVFLYALLRMNRQFLESQGTGTTFLELSKKKIESMRIMKPGTKSQNQFAVYFLAIDKLKFSF